MAKVVWPDPGQLLITVPVGGYGPNEELEIAFIKESFVRDVA